MWLFTSFGFFSIVRKSENEPLTIRARTRGDLDRLKGNYLPGMSDPVSHAGTDYPWRATATQAELSEAMSTILADLDYSNFKNEVALNLGPSRGKRYGNVWSALYGMPEDLAESPSLMDDQQLWATQAPKGKVAYGGIVLDRWGRFLLRQVRNGYDGYVWSFAKGRPDPGESPQATARREVREEMGVGGAIVSPLKGEFLGGTTVNRYFVMVVDERTVSLDYRCKETDGLCWAEPDEARRLIALTTNAVGKQRDLSLVDAVAGLLGDPVPLKRPFAIRTDWKRRPFPARRETIALDETFTDQDMARIWRGFVPAAMEEKWFAFFEDCTLHLFRSWTGLPIFRFHFEPTPDGWRIARAEVTRRTEHYKPDSSEDELNAARGLVRGLLSVPDQPSEDGFVTAMKLAQQPNYLGSPDVVGPLTHHYVSLLIKKAEDFSQYQASQNELQRLTRIMSGGDEDYTAMPMWHTVDALGASLVTLADLDAEYCHDEPLSFIVLEALASVALAVSRVMRRARTDPSFAPPQVIEVLTQLSFFVRDMFLGTTSVNFPDQRLSTLVPMTWGSEHPQ